jgi:hypothetical protein
VWAQRAGVLARPPILGPGVVLLSSVTAGWFGLRTRGQTGSAERAARSSAAAAVWTGAVRVRHRELRRSSVVIDLARRRRKRKRRFPW